MDTDAFVTRLVAEVPEAAPVLAEHLRDNDELLLHLFVADLRRMCDEAWTSNNLELLQRLLGSFDQAFGAADELVSNAVAVSFVEDSCLWDPANEEYIASWPEGLLAEATRQRTWERNHKGAPGAQV
jgi:hypothetical protein